MDFLGGILVRAKRMANVDDDGEDFHLMHGMMMPFQYWSFKLIQLGREEDDEDEDEINFFSLFMIAYVLSRASRVRECYCSFSRFFLYDRTFSDLLLLLFVFFYIGGVYTHGVLSLSRSDYITSISFFHSKLLLFLTDDCPVQVSFFSSFLSLVNNVWGFVVCMSSLENDMSDRHQGSV